MFQGIFRKISEIVFTKYYKKVMIIPILLTLFFSFFLINNKIKYGYFVKKDISIEGGYIVRFSPKDYKVIDEILKEIKNKCDKCYLDVFSTIDGKKIVEIRLEKSEEIFKKVIEVLDKYNIKEYTYSSISGKVGKDLLKNLIKILIISVIFVSIAVFYFFRSLLPTLSIVLSTFLTIVDLLGILVLFKISFSIIILGVILMIFGYSVGSDSILGVYLFKRGGKIEDRIINAFNIVIKQEITSTIVFLLLFFLSTINEVKIISLVAIFGFIFDLINTWLLTAQIQRIIIEKHGP